MARRSDRSLACLLLAQRLVDAGVPPLKAAEYWTELDAVPDPGALLRRAADDVAATTGLAPDRSARIAALFGAVTSFAFALDEAEQTGLQVVGPVDDGYPVRWLDRLGRSAPPLLYAVGDVGLLDGDHLGVV